MIVHALWSANLIYLIQLDIIWAWKRKYKSFVTMQQLIKCKQEMLSCFMIKCHPTNSMTRTCLHSDEMANDSPAGVWGFTIV